VTETNLSPTQWGAVYREKRRLYDSFSTRIQSLLVELLASEGITTVQVDARTKDVQSFIEKIGREPGKYLDPLTDLTDLAGVRVIVYYASDVERVDALVEREFVIDRQNSWRRTPTADPDRFGYRSDHYVVSCSSSRAELGEWLPYNGLKAEIQVRTALQHAWAAIDHRLNYKRASEIPVELKRQLFRLSALLEVADDQFEAVRLGAERLSSSYDHLVSSGELELPIDRTSVEVYLDRSPRAQRWAKAATRAGFNLEESPLGEDPEVGDYDAIGDLTQASQVIGFANLAELDEFLDQAKVWGERALTALRPAGAAGEWFAPLAFILSSLVYIGSDLSRDALKTNAGGADFYIDGLLQARKAINSH
jgi:putative GTP pyrophosphokinase